MNDYSYYYSKWNQKIFELTSMSVTFKKWDRGVYYWAANNGDLPFIFDLITINSRRLNENDIYTDYKQVSNAHARSVYEINIWYIGCYRIFETKQHHRRATECWRDLSIPMLLDKTGSSRHHFLGLAPFRRSIVLRLCKLFSFANFNGFPFYLFDRVECNWCNSYK